MSLEDIFWIFLHGCDDKIDIIHCEHILRLSLVGSGLHSCWSFLRGNLPFIRCFGLSRGILWRCKLSFVLIFSLFPSLFLVYFISSSSYRWIGPTFLWGIVLLISFYVLRFLLFLLFLCASLSIMFDPGDQGTFNDVGVINFCIFH
jgi:hypothetical protein